MGPIRFLRWLLLRDYGASAFGFLLAAFPLTAYAESSIGVSFEDEIAPILSDRCAGCHTPGIEKGGLSLATAEGLLKEGYLIAGDAEGSHLVSVISPSEDGPPSMPHEGPPLTTEQIERIRAWVQQGAVWPEDVIVREKPKADGSWWSLQPITDPTPPDPAGLPEAWEANPIDRFVFARMQQEGLRPNPAADPRTLRRRLSYGVTGLPPDPNEAIPSEYEVLVHRLLDSKAYGEHWGRHWLDVVRFGESRGYERNMIIDTLWPFRDYIIRSLNEDKPFDRLIHEHLAGDLEAEDTDAQVGSAFLVAGPYDDVPNLDPAQAAQIEANRANEIILATSEAFLGLTVGCARCHDHKFDPILQSDYYRLHATFAGVRHGEKVVASKEAREEHIRATKPLKAKRRELDEERKSIYTASKKRSEERLEEIRSTWARDPIRRTGVTEEFAPTEARYVRLVCEANDVQLERTTDFRIDEFEVWSSATEEQDPRNVALASAEGRAIGEGLEVKDFPGAYAVELVNDGEFSGFFISRGESLTIELPTPILVDRVVFSSIRGEEAKGGNVFKFLAEYRIEVSRDGETWTTVADSHDRRPVNDRHLRHRLRQEGLTDQDSLRLEELSQRIRSLDMRLAAIPALTRVWVGTREAAEGPFHVMIGGDPARLGEEVTAGSLATLSRLVGYELPAEAPESERRQRLADWITDPANPLTARVLVNRVWHYHFGVGIVDTPSDFGYMGGRPTHSELLDWLATRLIESGWRLKPIHRLILTSQAYRQSSAARHEAIARDAESRLLWRFPPRRLAAEELRDTMLALADRLQPDDGGPGFRLYRYWQDNVATYVPRDEPGADTYRRAVYHQNARSAPVDLLAEFDQPDCSFSTPRRSATTTPLQALTLLNHPFTLDMAKAFSDRLAALSADPARRVELAYAYAYDRKPSSEERLQCAEFAQQHGWPALCRVLLNTAELITIR